MHFIPLHRQPYWRDRYGLCVDNFPDSEAAFTTNVSLPIYSAMTNPEVDPVIEAVKDVLS